MVKRLHQEYRIKENLLMGYYIKITMFPTFKKPLHVDVDKIFVLFTKPLIENCNKATKLTC